MTRDGPGQPSESASSPRPFLCVPVTLLLMRKHSHSPAPGGTAPVSVPPLSLCTAAECVWGPQLCPVRVLQLLWAVLTGGKAAAPGWLDLDKKHHPFLRAEDAAAEKRVQMLQPAQTRSLKGESMPVKQRAAQRVSVHGACGIEGQAWDCVRVISRCYVLYSPNNVLS